jgi:hypothetical protein
MTYDQWKTTEPDNGRWPPEEPEEAEPHPDDLYDREMERPAWLKTSYWAKPIPTRSFDWEAWHDNHEPNDNGQMIVGYGRTEAEAIADLLEQLE